MANTLLSPDAITKETLRVIHNALPFIKNVDKQHDKETVYAGQKNGGSIRIRKPNKYTVRTNWTLSAQDSTEEATTLTIGTVRGVDMNFTDAELALNIDEFSKRFITPAVMTLASNVDYYCFQQAVNATYQSVGSAGSVPSTALVWLQAGQKLNESAAPVQMRKAVVSPGVQANMVDGLKGLLNPNNAISNQYLSGTMGTALGFDWYMTQNTPVHTCGSRAGTILVDDAGGTYNTEGSTQIHVDGLSSATATFTVGDIFTVAGVYRVNSETKQSTGALQQFVVTAAATAASNEVTLSISPALHTTGAAQNITAFPADGAAVTPLGTASTGYIQNLTYVPEAYTFASANLEMPNDVSFKGQAVSDGISLRILRQYDINTANYPCRIDIFFGFLAQYPEFACRVTE
jgi:hypothetical protein